MAVNLQTTVDADEFPMGRLRERYQEQGFDFIPNPRREELPDFFGAYRPDAIALKPGLNVAIQFLRPRMASLALSLDEIRRLFIDHPDWQLVVSHGEVDPLMSDVLPAASEASIRIQLKEMEDLGRTGQSRAAFVMGWSLLEAVLHRLDDEGNRRPRKPGTVLESLARLGYLSPELEVRLRPLVLLRNRIVHGDISAEPSADDLQAIFSAIDEALA
ncbi:hypothetical protein SAMN05880561_103128 [Rhizobium sp. RU33A]|uniref:HepT-like ribonuclease domain-containing protein n=1 Tax=Rhizobium sp. RU33A TaxID=1907413 RepID=UPI000954F1D1|nr:HepT-like ribonuclease domain-containing protein [Rhizobium sp. RU33A]SIQ47712.1 hypothetical protein SAMN05880561_103128 [Rhizobium sp. RU33A]